MRLISLNTWGGRAGKEKLLDFFDRYRETDIFCLQEIWSAPYEHLEGAVAGGRPIDHQTILYRGLQEISALLSEHTAYFRPHFGDNYGLLLLVKKQHQVIDQGEVWVHKYQDYHPEGDIGKHARNLQWATIATSDGPITVLNFHGLWNGEGKGDSPDRLLQSENIVSFIKGLETPVIFSGDFNLNPETESIRKITEIPLRNLIEEYSVRSTRSSLYDKPGKFADYIFVSRELEIQNFQVLPDEVSDHLALSIDF